MNYINKQKATDKENILLVEAWNSLKTSTLTAYHGSNSKEGITFFNLSTFLHVINYIFPSELLKHVALDGNLEDIRPFGHLSSQGIFYVQTQ